MTSKYCFPAPKFSVPYVGVNCQILLNISNELIAEKTSLVYSFGCDKDESSKNQLSKILMTLRQDLRDRIFEE